jgi:predicted dehydrogenase
MSDRLRVGVVGSGIGQSHIQAYQSLPNLFEVTAICDINQVTASDVAETYGISRAVTDLVDLCRMDDLDVIDLCTPSYLHYPQALQVLAVDKHVICEKPVTGSLKEIDELIVAEAKSDKRVMPIFQKRFGHGAQKLKLLIEAGVAGQVYLTTIETAWRRPS